jgi:hypothetical protein
MSPLIRTGRIGPHGRIEQTHISNAGPADYPPERRSRTTSRRRPSNHSAECVDRQGGGTTTLTLYLPNNVSAAQVAAEVARRAARYRLATKNLNGELRQTLEALPSVKAIDGPSRRPVREKSAGTNRLDGSIQHRISMRRGAGRGHIAACLSVATFSNSCVTPSVGCVRCRPAPTSVSHPGRIGSGECRSRTV